ncbi:AAA domain-containing protein [Actinomadura meyerae]|uniref:AAA domain-containing protein n=1 Tax=Actinomadura meyerae TaxID=240840 RepID=A0A239BWN7_9ACTN|nr:AAA family ATPase [Actinomadura meyerae]SNS11474.1 AAA domain-containing protein [Actinomadura meyerae]
MRISYQGKTYRLIGPVHAGAELVGADVRGNYRAPVAPELRGELIRQGQLTQDDGTPITGRPAQRVRDRLLGTYDHLPQWGDRDRRDDAPRRMLISGLWPWGHIPVLGGNAKAGKTTLVADLAKALVLPGYRFLGHFDPVTELEYWNWEDDDDAEEPPPDRNRGRGVVLINAETPRDDMEAAVGPDRGWGSFTPDALRIAHLEDMGGASWFDVTDPEKYDRWAHELTACEECDGSDELPPFAVIVDGVTAILGGDMNRYGEWYAAFRRLLREIDVPNGLAVFHNTMSGGHPMGGVGSQTGADGLWRYSSGDSDDPASSRWFSVNPRLGGVPIRPTKVVLSEETGRPVLVDALPPNVSPELPVNPTEEDKEADEAAGKIMLYVTEHPGAHGAELTDNVDCGSKGMNLAGRTRAVNMELLVETKCGQNCRACAKAGLKPYYRRLHYWPSNYQPDDED